MDDGKILLVNLAKGRLGEDSSSLLGGLLVTTIGLAAYSRADIAENQRKGFLTVTAAPEFVGRFGETDLVQLPNYSIDLKLMIHGSPSQPFSARTLKMNEPSSRQR